MEKYLIRLRSAVLFSLLFLFPLFFLPFTQEFFATNKLYLLTFSVLLLLAISTVEFFLSKKIVWEAKPLDTSIILFTLTVALSLIIVSPNKIQAILNSNFGLLEIVSLTILYFYLSREKNQPLFWTALLTSSLVVSLLAILSFFQIFKFLPLPNSFEFLKSPQFTPVGNPFDLVVYLGIFSLMFVIHMILNKLSGKTVSFQIVTAVSFIIVFLAFLLTLYGIIKSATMFLPPLRISWYGAVEILKNPLTALFGVGVDNFASIFTRVKDTQYSLSPLWQINAFSVSRSALLHIFTETGLFGFAAFVLIIITLLKLVYNLRAGFSNINILRPVLFMGITIVLMVMFLPSLLLFFLFFVGLSFISQIVRSQPASEIDLSSILPVYLGVGILLIVIIGATGFLVVQSYAAEYYFKKSVDAIAKNNIKDLYDNQRQAVIINPYIERLRINFSQTNMLIANNVASKAQTNSSNSTNPSNSTNQLSDQDRQTITSAIQAAIAEAKAAVALNPQRASNWENLAVIYRNILNVAQGADSWTISAYQRAIVLDPQNPIYRLNLGGVFYSLKNWDEAYGLFTQAVGLKSDWPNAYYNLAWASYQKGAYQQAVNAMQNTISLLDSKTSKADYDKASKELEEFKKKLPKTEEQTATESAQPQKQQLALPTPPVPALSPKIELPKNASPESR